MKAKDTITKYYGDRPTRFSMFSCGMLQGSNRKQLQDKLIALNKSKVDNLRDKLKKITLYGNELLASQKNFIEFILNDREFQINPERYTSQPEENFMIIFATKFITKETISIDSKQISEFFNLPEKIPNQSKSSS